jgi:oligopeptide/dipeptide ABC transporter ATP-binding protein
MSCLLKTEGLKKYFYPREGILGKKRVVKAVNGVNISVYKDSIFAVVGESGSGKSTLARLLLRLIEPTEGRVIYRETDISRLGKDELKEFRRKVQVVFQDPFSSLNPRMTVFSILSEPLKIHRILTKKRQLRERVVELLETVGLKAEHMGRYPHEFSGGQRQRICIARALALEPELVIADEPLSALDVSIQAQILNLLSELRETKGLSFVFISHDLNLVHYFSDYVAVMYRGRIVEEGLSEVVFQSPLHPYTKTLLDALPRVRVKEGGVIRRRGAVSFEREEKEGGCSFYPRCPEALEVCRKEEPPLREIKNRKVACLRI